MRLWQRARYARNTTAIIMLWTPAYVPMAATAITAIVVAEYQVETIRKAREEVFELGEIALSKAFVGVVDHMARVHNEHRKTEEVAVKKPAPAVPAEIGRVASGKAETVDPPRQVVEPPPRIGKPARAPSRKKTSRKAPPCTCPADRGVSEGTGGPSYEPGFYGTAPDYRTPYSFYGED